MSFHQTPEEIIKNATAEQRILWNYIFLQFGEKIGISQFHLNTQLAASEFLTYSDSKMYLGLDVKFSAVPTWSAGNARIDFYSGENINNFTLSDPTAFWDATAVLMKQSGGNLHIKNILFSRVVVSVYSSISFIGYRLNI